MSFDSTLRAANRIRKAGKPANLVTVDRKIMVQGAGKFELNTITVHQFEGGVLTGSFETQGHKLSDAVNKMLDLLKA